jgi:hypothetical protein
MCRKFLRYLKAFLINGMIWAFSHSSLELPSVSLLRTYAPNSPSLLTLAFLALINNLCRLLQAPANDESFPALSLLIFLWMSNPLSRCSSECSFSFLPLKLRPSASRHASAFAQHHVQQLQYVANFRNCRYFFMFRPPHLLAIQVARTIMSLCT